MPFSLLLLAVYGLVCFLFLYNYYDMPKGLKRYLQSSYTFFEYTVFSYFFFVNIKSGNFKKFIISASILFLVYQCAYIFSNSPRRLDSIPIGLETILLIVYIVYFLIEYLKNITSKYIFSHHVFWIAAGVLVYLGGSFFFFILINNLTKEQIVIFGNLTYVAEILKNLLFAISMYILSKSFLVVDKRKKILFSN